MYSKIIVLSEDEFKIWISKDIKIDSTAAVDSIKNL
jgi:hypothetical protein